VLEEMPIDESGLYGALNLADYKPPSIADIPTLRTILLKPSTANGPFAQKWLANAATPRSRLLSLT